MEVAVTVAGFLGVGSVGKTFLKIILDKHDHLKKLNVGFKFVILADSTAIIFCKSVKKLISYFRKGFDIEDVLNHKKQGKKFVDYPNCEKLNNLSEALVSTKIDILFEASPVNIKVRCCHSDL